MYNPIGLYYFRNISLSNYNNYRTRNKMTQSDFIDFCDNYVGNLIISGNIALDINTGVYYE